MTTTADWLPDSQQALTQLSDQAQQRLETGAEQYLTSAIANAPSELQVAIKLLGAVVSGAVEGYLTGAVLPATATAALSEIGISAAAGETVGPIGAVVGALVAAVVVMATEPWASGSMDNRSPMEKATDAINAGMLQSTGGSLLAQYYWGLEITKVYPQTACPQGGFGCIDTGAEMGAVGNFYIGAICQNADACAVVTDSQVAALVDNALHRMPPPDKMKALIAANGGTGPNLGVDNVMPTSAISPGDQFYPGASFTFTDVYACAAMAGAGSAELAAQTQTLITAMQAQHPELVGPLQDILLYYTNVVPFQGGNPTNIFGGGGGKIIPIGNLKPGAFKLPPKPTSTATKIAVGTGAAAGLGALGVLWYSIRKGISYTQAAKDIWGKTTSVFKRKRRR